MTHLRAAAWWRLPVMAVLLTACAVTRQGTLEELSGAVTLPVAVSVEAESAWLRAVDLRSGEVLQGRLALDPSGRHSRASVHPEPPLPSGSAGLGAAGAGVPLRGGTVMNLTGLVHGDRGTVLRCSVHIEQRVRLRGAGLCHDTREGANRSFRLRF